MSIETVQRILIQQSTDKAQLL